MNSLQIISDPEVEIVFNNYPDPVRKRIVHLRKLILEAANEIEGLKSLEETLKWGEPSYLSKFGSTIRIDWKEKKPNQYSMYFKCTSKLVPSFKIVFGDVFKYEGNRAIIFQMNDTIPEREIKQCIATALTYHKVKHLAVLGL